MDVTDLLDLNSFSESPDEDYFVFHVYRGKLHDGTMVEISTNGEDFEGEDWRKNVQNTLEIWTKCIHPNITQLIGKATFRENLAVVYHGHEYGSIYEYLKVHPREFSDRSRLSAQICDGVAYLHSNGIMHGDLGGHCIMISGDGVPHIRLSVLTTLTVLNAVEYSPMWITMDNAPELDERGAKYTFASDVFALGMAILETFTGDLWGSSDFHIFSLQKQLKQGEPPSRPTVGIPEDAAGNMLWDILCKCWSFKPEDRPTVSEVSAVMHMVCKTLDGVALIPPRLVVREDTSMQDLVSYFEERGIMNYTEFFHPASIVATVSVADTALANVYRLDTLFHEPVAIKCVKHNTPYKRLKRAARELSCWSLYTHENILPLFGFMVVGGDLAMVAPWMNNGFVTEYVNRNLSCNRLDLCIQLARVISYLHAHNMVHGDIKGPNVLISDAHTIQVADFGVSIVDHKEIQFTATSAGRGTERWQAPEILEEETDSSKEGDVYALGMTMIEIYTGEPPYGKGTWSFPKTKKVVQGKLRPPRPTRILNNAAGNSVWELMTQCWAGVPTERPSSREVYEALNSEKEGVV